ncbi:MAG TPA: hypothetical protein VK631_27540 [Solirubrobacteraceae bacterium]|nr:hypothetical protein [Solirubrobacteraceae bacterium]
MTRRLILALAVAIAGMGTVGVAVAVVSGGEEGARTSAAPRAPDLAECRRLGGDLARACYTREYLAMVHGREDPRPAVAAIAKDAWKEGPSLVANCHGIMHTVGRTYASEAGVDLATLMDHLPQSNDPGCTAGFAHGMVTAIAPDIDPTRPGEAARVCGSAKTRYQNYSCIHGFGHAFMRIYGDKLGPALHLCRALGPRAAADCAQGAYHDYWFAVVGADDATLSGEEAVKDPRVLCGAAPEEFVRPCWYRAWVENRPEAFDVATAEDLDALCYRLRGLQRAACITGASVIGPPDPVAQIELCAQLATGADAASCVRGVKVQNLLGRPIGELVELVDRCSTIAGGPRDACYRWLGKAVAVLTDGEFARAGCPRLRGTGARRACAEGAATMDDALETFS